jgi:hypothetical protein
MRGEELLSQVGPKITQFPLVTTATGDCPETAI